MELGIITTVFRTLWLPFVWLYDRWKPLSAEQVDKLNKDKRNAKSAYFRRILVKDGAHDELLPIVTRARLDTDSAVFAAFGSHALHGAVPVSRAGLVSPDSPGRLRPAVSVVDRATTNFHSMKRFRIDFFGYKMSKLSTEQQDEIGDEIYQDLIRPLSSSKVNEVTLVAGEIGCGKSTLLTNLLYRINTWQASQSPGRSPQTIPVEVALISFDKMIQENKNEAEKFESGYIRDYIADQIRDQTNLRGDSIERLVENRRGSNLVLIFDDMDGIYQLFCKLYLTQQDTFDPRQGLREYFPFVFDLIRMFSSGALSQLGLRCVFGIRIDTLRMIERALGPTLAGSSVIENLRGHYIVDEISGELIANLVHKRFELALFIEKRSIKKSILVKRIEELKKSKIDFDSVSRISVQGLRHTVHIIQQLDWCIDDDFTFNRFFSRNGDLRLFFLIGGYRHFSQVNQGITNIFLVNSSYRRDNNPPLINGHPAFSEKFLAEHRHSYFLKYLILIYVHKVQTDQTDIRSLFSEIGGYEREIVELILFSLCEVKHGRLLRPKIAFNDDASISCSGLEVTKRGQFFVDKEIFWSFEYLSMVIEDHWLQVPIAVGDIFDCPIGYQFIVEKGRAAYEHRLAGFLDNKAKVVPQFLALLEIAFGYERRSRGQLFRVLDRHGIGSLDFPKIRNGCREELKATLLNVSLSERESILSVYDKYASASELRRLRKLTKSAFKSCY